MLATETKEAIGLGLEQTLNKESPRLAGAQAVAEFVVGPSGKSHSRQQLGTAAAERVLPKPQEFSGRALHGPEFRGSQAFRLEYTPETPAGAIYDDVITYLAEYRLQARETFYELLYSRGPDGLHVRDMNRGVAMASVARESMARGENVGRRRAEYAALQGEDEALANAEDGDLTIQMSPPGEISEEAGEYGFIFIGKVEEIEDEQKIIHKNAIRIDNATLDQYNMALSLITGHMVEHRTAEEFIADPRLLDKTISYDEIKDILHDVFNFEPSAEEREHNNEIILQVEPFIQHFIRMVQSGESAEKSFGLLQKIENIVLDLKGKKTSQVRNATTDIKDGKYAKTPPPAEGSCGLTTTGSKTSLISKVFGAEAEDEFGSLRFKCPQGHPNKRPRGEQIPRCKKCGVSVKC